MKLGVNLTSPSHLPTVMELIQTGKADFCELLIDNFVHLSPEAIRSELGDTPIAFHIMSSRFLEKEPAELAWLAAKLRHFITKLSPLYISDHIARFSVSGRSLPITVECDYQNTRGELLSKIALWQELIGEKLYLENFPSSLDCGRNQIDFFREMIRKIGSAALFDVSNALVAEFNCGLERSQWKDVYLGTHHFHVGGYRTSGASNSNIVIDSHDCDVSEDALAFIRQIARIRKDRESTTIVVERDGNISSESWSSDLLRVREALCST